MKCKATSIGLCEMYPNFEFPTEAVLKRLAVRSRVRGLRFSNTRANSMRQLRKSRLVAICTEEVLLMAGNEQFLCVSGEQGREGLIGSEHEAPRH